MRAPPPGSFSATMVPPSAVTTWATMARPRPEPGRPRAAGRAVEAVEDVGQVGLGDAGAVVTHHDGAVPALDGDRLAGRAPLAGVVEQVAHGAAEAVGMARHPARLGVEVEPHVFRPPVGVLHRHRVAHEEVEPQRLPRRRLLVAPGQLGQVADEVGELLELHQDVVDQDRAVLGAQLVDAADDLEVGAQAGEGRAQLVGRVEDELTLGPARRLERLEQTVEGLAQAAQFVGSPGGEPARHVGRLGHILNGVGEGVERDERGAGHEPAQRHREEHADEGDRAQEQRELLELRVDVEQRGDLQRAAVDEGARLDRRAGGQVLDVLAHLVPVHGDGVEEGGGEVDRDQPDLARDGEPASRDHGARRVDDLARGGRGRPDLLAGEELLRGRGERVVGRLQQRVARHQERAEGRRQHGDDDGGGRRQDEAGAEGHASRST